MTQPSELTSLLQQLIEQQREDMRVAEERAEVQRKDTQAQLAQMQQEVARDHAASEVRFAGIIDGVTQRHDAQTKETQ